MDFRLSGAFSGTFFAREPSIISGSTDQSYLGVVISASWWGKGAGARGHRGSLKFSRPVTFSAASMVENDADLEAAFGQAVLQVLAPRNLLSEQCLFTLFSDQVNKCAAWISLELPRPSQFFSRR